MKHAWGVVALGWALCLSGQPVWAQYSVPAEATSGQRVGSARSKVHDELVRAAGWEVGASLNFITSDGLGYLGGDPTVADRRLKFTDVVLLRLHGLWSVAGSLELFAGTDIVPKQPSYTDELIWQGSSAGVRYGFSNSIAWWARGHGGPQLGRAGYWAGAETAVQYKQALEEVLFWETDLGVNYGRLLFDDDFGAAYWQTEILAKSGIAIREPKGYFGAWLSFAFHFPVASHPGRDDIDPMTDPFLDPQTRVGMQLGALIGISRTVDLFMEWDILDRGDGIAPETTLPVLNGGFDQKQLIFGFMRRFDSSNKTKK
jgi:hypothetical protein